VSYCIDYLLSDTELKDAKIEANYVLYIRFYGYC
jgi:hypothetical protein